VSCTRPKPRQPNQALIIPQSMYDTNSNQIPKNEKISHAHALGRLPTLHPRTPTNEIKAEGKSAFPLSPRDTRSKRDLRLSGGSRKCGRSASNHLNQRNLVRKTPRSPNPVAKALAIAKVKGRCALSLSLGRMAWPAKRCEPTDSIDFL
jgi:hypothetical protein